MIVSFEWGLSGAMHYASSSDLIIVVDTLCFSTSVDIATSRDVSVLPYPNRDYDEAERYSQGIGALVARKRSYGSYSISPASLLNIPINSSLVLPSPNGSHISALTSPKVDIVLGCFRNAEAINIYIRQRPDTSSITVIAAGERWPDQSLRPAIEDYLAAGAILDKLNLPLSAEAQVARNTYVASKDNVSNLLFESLSGRELQSAGYQQDISIALEADVSSHIPLFTNGAFNRFNVRP